MMSTLQLKSRPLKNCFDTKNFSAQAENGQHYGAKDFFITKRIPVIGSDDKGDGFFSPAM